MTAAAAAPALAEPRARPERPHAQAASRAAPEQQPQARAAASARGEGYREQLVDKLPFGSAAWWEQMRREGRLGGETP